MSEPLRARLNRLIATWRESAAWEAEQGNHHRASDVDQCADELEAALREPLAAAPLEVAAQAVVTAFLAWHTTRDVWVSDDLLNALSDLCEVVEARDQDSAESQMIEKRFHLTVETRTANLEGYIRAEFVNVEAQIAVIGALEQAGACLREISDMEDAEAVVDRIRALIASWRSDRYAEFDVRKRLSNEIENAVFRAAAPEEP
jgi:hypothetical protein